MNNPLDRLGSNGRMVGLTIAALLLVGAILLARSATNNRFVPLFRGVELSQAGTMADALEKAGIEYRLEGSGGDISVAEGDAARARVVLAQGGLPSGGRPGLELFDKPSWGMTDFTQHVTYRRALEGELARTIGTLRGVEKAQVHLAIPESSPLRKLDRPAEAAVVVALKPNTTLSPDQVRGISQLVSSSVEGLTPENVAVLDDSGRPLAGVASADMANGLSSKQLEMQQAVEEHVAGKVRTLLTAALGAEAVRVQVAARLNFDQVERSVEAYDTAGQVLRSQQRSEAVPDTMVGGTTSTILNSEFLNSRTVERIIGSVGSVTQLTVSALVDTRALGSEGSLQDADRERLAGVVRDAIGYDEARGDRVSVVAMPFSAEDNPTPLVASVDELDAGGGADMLEVVSRLAFPVLALLALLVAAMIGWKAVTRPVPRALASGDAAGSLSGQEGYDQMGQPGSADMMPPPQASARVLRSWMAEPT